MLEASWENHASALANAPTSDDFIRGLYELVQITRIDVSKPARVIYARDTRPSGPELVSAFEAGLKCIGAQGRNEGVTTTPVLHYLVRCINTKGKKDEYGEDSEEGYIKKLAEAFKKLTVSLTLELFAVCAHLRSLIDKFMGRYT